MPTWAEAIPLIGVILTVAGSIFGIVWAGKRRAMAPAVPAAVAGALAERGLAEGLTLAIGGLTAVIVQASQAAERDRDEDAELRRRHHDAMMEELRKLRIQMEMAGRDRRD